jgi:hypothetical protein
MSPNTPRPFLLRVTVRAFSGHLRTVFGIDFSHGCTGQSHPLCLNTCSLPMTSTHPPHLSFDQRQTQSMMQSVLTHDNSPNFSRKQTQDPLARLRGFGNAGVHGYRKREAVKFGAVNPDDLSSDDEDDPLSTPPPLARRTSTLSSLTLTNGSNVDSWKTSPMKGDQERGAPVRRAVLLDQENDAPDYSDYEEDVTNAQTHTDRNSAWLEAANFRTARLGRSKPCVVRWRSTDDTITHPRCG